MAVPYIEEIKVVPRRGKWAVRLTAWCGEEPDRRRSTVYEGPYDTSEAATLSIAALHRAASNGKVEFA